MLVNVNHHSLLHDALEAGLFGGAERDLRRRHTSYFADHFEYLRSHGEYSFRRAAAAIERQGCRVE